MKKVFAIVGWDIYYDYAMEQGWYEGLRRSKFESVFYADFEDLVYRLNNLIVMS